MQSRLEENTIEYIIATGLGSHNPHVVRQKSAAAVVRALEAHGYKIIKEKKDDDI